MPASAPRFPDFCYLKKTLIESVFLFLGDVSTRLFPAEGGEKPLNKRFPGKALMDSSAIYAGKKYTNQSKKESFS